MYIRGSAIASAALVCAALLSLGACSSTAPKDAGGRAMQLTEWRDIEPYDLDLNLALLVPGDLVRAQYQDRDHQVIHNRISFDNRKGYVKSQRVVDGFFTDWTKISIHDQEDFVREVKEQLRGDLLDHEVPVALTCDRRICGYGAVFNLKAPRGRCLFARAGYKFNPKKFDDDVGQYDTIVSLRYCDQEASLEKFNEFFDGVRPVRDREAFKAALADTGA